MSKRYFNVAIALIVSLGICTGVFYLTASSDYNQRHSGGLCTAQEIDISEKQIRGGLPIPVTAHYVDGINDCGVKDVASVKAQYHQFYHAPLFYVDWLIYAVLLLILFFRLEGRHAHSRN